MIAVGMRVYWGRHSTPESLYQQDQDSGKERDRERERAKKKAQYERAGASRDGRAAIHLVH